MFRNSKAIEVVIRGTSSSKFNGLFEKENTGEWVMKLLGLSNNICNFDSFSFQYARQSHDSKMLGEMIFGSVAMTYKGQTVKVHEIRYDSKGQRLT